MRFREEYIQLSYFDVADLTYQITTKAAIGELAQSISSIGLINPPVVTPKNNKYTIVCGFRRIAACIQLGFPGIDAHITDLSPVECATLAIADNNQQRPLNWIEISRAIHLIFEILADESKARNLLSILGLPDNIDMAKKVLPLMNLPEAVQMGIISDQIPLPVALDLGELDPTSANLLADIFQKLGFGLNIQREIVTLVKEVAARESITVLNLLEGNSIRHILDDPDSDRTRKRNLFRDYLKSRRYPFIQKAQTEFQNNLKHLKLPNSIRLTAPKYFEGNQYTFQIDFSNNKQLKSRLNTLKQASEAPELQNILKGFNPDKIT